MKRLSLRLTCIILVTMLVLAVMHTSVKAADLQGVILEKATGEKIIYINGMESKEFKYAFSDNSDAESAMYLTSTKDSNNESVALLEKGKTYKYMFIQEENTETIKLDSLKNISEEEIKNVEKLTEKIKVSTDESESKVSKEGNKVVTTTKGKIVITDKGNYEYQLIEILDKNQSAKSINQTALELYNQLDKIKNASNMYEKLKSEVTIRDNYSKLMKDAKWKKTKNNEILQPENSQDGEKYVVLIRKVENGKTVKEDVQFMTCSREDKEGVEQTEKEEKKLVEKKTKLPVTGENLALYIIFGIIILAIIVVIIRMKKTKKDE